MPKFLAFLLLFVVSEVSSQTQTTARTDAILGLVNYRDELIGVEGIAELEALDSLWTGTYQDFSTSFMLKVVHAHEMRGIPVQQMLEQAEKEEMNPWLRILIEEETIETILKHKDLIDLLIGGILLPNPPFQIDSKTTFFKELDIYKIENGMTVAEIGAGNGVFSLLLGLAYDSLHIFVNDLRPQLYMQWRKPTAAKAKKPVINMILCLGRKSRQCCQMLLSTK